jgi:polyisoprenoid-binding protein YceI
MNRLAAAAVLMGSVALSGSAPLGVERYTFDASRSQVSFVVRHLGVNSVRGKFSKFDGEIQLDETDLTKSTVRVSIDAASIDTEIEKRDNHLRSADFFEVDKFPTLTFVGRRVEKKGAQLHLIGDLTIRDVTREVAVPFTLSRQTVGRQKRIKADASLEIDRFDYGLNWNRITEAVAVVAPEVRIELTIEAVALRPTAVD